MRVAILEDDSSQTALLSYWLKLAGHDAYAFNDGADLLEALQRETFDALLLDWNVPDLSGVPLVKRVRQQLHSSVPVLFVFGRDREDDVVMALREGADDYMVKPGRRWELLARLEALSRRRPSQERADVIKVDVFRIDCQTRTLLRKSQQLHLSAKDFDLTVLFLRNVGQLLSRAHIRKAIWGSNAAVASRTLDTHVSRIRQRLGLTPEHGWRLTARYRFGYRLDRVIPTREKTADRNDAGHRIEVSKLDQFYSPYAAGDARKDASRCV